MSDPRIGFPVVIGIRPVIGIAYRVIIPPVRPVVHQAETYSRPHKIPVPWPVYIMPVIEIYITAIVCKYAAWVIVNI